MGLLENLKKRREKKLVEKQALQKAMRIAKEKEEAAYRQSMIAQSQRIGQERAKIQTQRRIKQIRSGRGGFGGGIIGGLSQKINTAAENLGYAPQKISKKINKKIKRPKIVKIKGKSYQLIQPKKSRKKRKRVVREGGYDNPFGTSLF